MEQREREREDAVVHSQPLRFIHFHLPVSLVAFFYFFIQRISLTTEVPVMCTKDRLLHCGSSAKTLECLINATQRVRKVFLDPLAKSGGERPHPGTINVQRFKHSTRRFRFLFKKPLNFTFGIKESFLGFFLGLAGAVATGSRSFSSPFHPHRSAIYCNILQICAVIYVLKTKPAYCRSKQ